MFKALYKYIQIEDIWLDINVYEEDLGKTVDYKLNLSQQYNAVTKNANE